MILSHRIRLDPTVVQVQYFARATGTARFVWNWALAEWNRLYAAGEKPKASELRVAFNAIKYERWPWLTEIHRDAHAQPFANLQRAFVAFFKKTARRPTFKKKGKTRDSFYVANDKFAVDGFIVRLPVVGCVRMTEQLRFTGKVMSATVSRECDAWFIAIAVDVAHPEPTAPTGESVGVDLGLTTFATLSTGEKVEAPKPLRAAMRRLRRVSRWHSRKVKGSSNRRKASMRLAKVHRRVRNIRRDFIHKFTTRLAKTHSQIGIEDLNVKGMVANHHLARVISDVAWSETRRQLEYKTVWYGSGLMVFDRFYPSSKLCSHCGCVVEQLPLSVREWTCAECGAAHDRDGNAAENLKPTTGGLPERHACGERRGKGAHRSRNYNGGDLLVLSP